MIISNENQKILDFIRKIYPKLAGELKEEAEQIFPELSECEDERIREEMIEVLGEEAKEFPSSVIASKANSWIAWLEK